MSQKKEIGKYEGTKLAPDAGKLIVELLVISTNAWEQCKICSFLNIVHMTKASVGNMVITFDDNFDDDAVRRRK